VSRAKRIAKTKQELESISLESLNEEIKYLEMRRDYVGTGTVARGFQKEINAARNARLRRFGE
jgi:hypothetical protein